MSDFIKYYNQQEEKNIQITPLHQRNIFSPITYLSTASNFTMVRNIKELSHYVESSHWEGTEDVVESKLRGLTYEEFDKLKIITSKIWNFSRDFHYQTTAKSDLLTHFYQRRLINEQFPNIKSILEIGPGSGYLSLLLAMDGKQVFATDITQSLYVWQNYLFDKFELLTELVIDDALPNLNQSKGNVIHVPWWKFRNFEKHVTQVDLVTINHAICEMDIGSIQFILSLLKKIGYPKIFMEGLGSNAISIKNNNRIQNIFRIFGYKLTHNSNDVYIYEHDENIKKIVFFDILRFIAYLPFLRNLIRFIVKETTYLISILQIFLKKFKKKKFILENRVGYLEILNYYKDLTNDNLSNDNEKFIREIEAPGGILSKINISSFYE